MLYMMRTCTRESVLREARGQLGSGTQPRTHKNKRTSSLREAGPASDEYRAHGNGDEEVCDDPGTADCPSLRWVCFGDPPCPPLLSRTGLVNAACNAPLVLLSFSIDEPDIDTDIDVEVGDNGDDGPGPGPGASLETP